MKTYRGHGDGDRYEFDFGPCSYANGWAQLDTGQDASYYGNWINPTKRMHFSYVEGDRCLVKCDNDAEFTAYVRETIAWHNEHGWGPALIDALADAPIKAEFDRLGLSDVLH